MKIKMFDKKNRMTFILMLKKEQKDSVMTLTNLELF